METRANYVAVGGFVLLIMVGLVVSVLWLAGRQFHQEYAYYQTTFSGPVTGLGTGTLVRYDGIDVGHVTDLEFDPDDPKLVIATLQIKLALRLHDDSVASIESQGLTGGSYVEITGGTKASPLVEATDVRPYPMLRSKPSELEQVVQSAPELVARLMVISDRLGDLLNDQNRQAIADILANLRDGTAVLSRRSGDLDSIIVDAAATMHELSASLRKVDTVLDKAGLASDQLSTALVEADGTAKRLDRLTDDIDKVVVDAQPELKEFAGPGLAQLTQLLGETRQLVASLTRVADQLGRDPNRLIFGDPRKGYTPP